MADIATLLEAKRDGRAVSVGLLGNAAEVFPELVKRGINNCRNGL